MVNLQGRLKSNKKLSAELTFNFQIEAIGEENCVCVCAHRLLVVRTLLTMFLDYFSVFAGQCAGLLEAWDAGTQL